MDMFPERHEWFQRAPNASEVLWLLEADVRAALAQGWHPLPNIVDRAFAFANWCFEPNQDSSLRSAAAISFFEHLPTCEPARAVLADRLSPKQWVELEPLFKQNIPEEDYNALLAEIRRVHGDVLPSDAPAT